ncbi:MAG: fimbria/pilus outer membrane usher protein [Betaproteobacteria bacterium]
MPTVVSPAPSGVQRILPMEVIVNGAKSGTWVFVEFSGALYAPRDAFEEWRVQLAPDTPTIDFKGQPYSALSAVPGFKAKIDFPNQSVELLFSPEVFSAQRVTKELVKRPVVSPVLPSVFLNYDLNYAASTFRNASASKDLGVLSELGFSNAWGVLTTSQAGSNLINTGTLNNMRRWRRLETTFTRDFPDENRTLRLGDTVTRAGMWGRNAYFGGIQFGSNFALTPGFIRQPLPVLTGISAAPSTVELYVNDVLRQVSSVPTGPFALDNFPIMTGSGETRLVVRDILGRETVIVQSFLTSGQLLAPGLNDWSVETGTVRRNLGVSSNSYGSGFASGTWSRGFTDSLTLEARAEVTSRLRATGLGLVLALPGNVLGKVALVGSHEDSAGTGAHWLVGLERQGLRNSLSFDIRGATRNFRQLGQDAGTKPIKLQIAGNWSWSWEGSSVGLGFASISQYDATRVSTVSGNFSKRIGTGSNLTITASHAVAGGSGTAVGLNLLVPLEDNRLVTASANRHNGQTDFYAAATQNPVTETGLGWRVLAGQQQNQSRVEGGSNYLGRYGRVSSDISLSPDQKALRLGANGGLVFADGKFFVTRRVDESFAVAEIKGYGDIGIGLGSNVLSRTDANGIALIPRLVPYQNNSVRVDPAELPINAEIDSIEQIAVPAWRSAVKVNFPVRSGRGALLKIVLDDKDVAPAGAIVSIEGDPQEFYVARRGEAFVTGLQPANRLLLKWNGQLCKFDLTLGPETPNEIARVGPLLCKGVSR